MLNRFSIALCLVATAAFATPASANPFYSASIAVYGEGPDEYVLEQYIGELTPTPLSATPVIPSGADVSVSGTPGEYTAAASAEVIGADVDSEFISASGDSGFGRLFEPGELPSLAGTVMVTAIYDVSVLSSGSGAYGEAGVDLTAYEAFSAGIPASDSDGIFLDDDGEDIGTLMLEFTGDFTDGLFVDLFAWSWAEGGTGDISTSSAFAEITSVTLNGIELLDDAPTPVPEPSTLALLALGGVGLLIHTRRRRRT